MPRLIQDSRRNPLDQNQCAALADDSDDEVPNGDASCPNNTNGTEDQGPHTYASVASSSSGSGDSGDQPSFSQLTKLPDTGMRQCQSHTGTQSNKRERTPKTKHTPRDNAVTAPSTMASLARNVCSDILSPIVGNMYVHSSSEEVSPTNSNDSKIEESRLGNLILKKVFEKPKPIFGRSENPRVKRLISTFSPPQALPTNRSIQELGWHVRLHVKERKG